MADLNYYAADTSAAVQRIRSRILAAAVMMLAVALVWLFAGGWLALLGLRRGSSVLPPKPAIIFCATAFLITAGFAYLGIGGLQRRRWFRPWALVIGWHWLFLGGLNLLTALIALQREWKFMHLASSGWRILAEFIIEILLNIGLGVAFPAALLALINSPTVRQTLEDDDPHVRWTDTFPILRLTLVVTLSSTALLLLLVLIDPFESGQLTKHPLAGFVLSLLFALEIFAIYLVVRGIGLGSMIAFAESVLFMIGITVAYFMLFNHAGNDPLSDLNCLYGFLMIAAGGRAWVAYKQDVPWPALDYNDDF